MQLKCLLYEIILRSHLRSTFHSNFGKLHVGNHLCSPVLSSCWRLTLPSKAVKWDCGGATGQNELLLFDYPLSSTRTQEGSDAKEPLQPPAADAVAGTGLSQYEYFFPVKAGGQPVPHFPMAGRRLPPLDFRRGSLLVIYPMQRKITSAGWKEAFTHCCSEGSSPNTPLFQGDNFALITVHRGGFILLQSWGSQALHITSQHARAHSLQLSTPTKPTNDLVAISDLFL